MNVKKIIALVSASVVMITASACGASGSGSDKAADGEYVLKIGEAQGALCHAPLQVAMEKGYLDDEGIKWERVDFGKGDIQAALGAGTIDCGFGLVGKFVQPIDNGLNMVVTAGMHTGCTKLLVKSDSGIKTIDDLKGKKIGVSSLAGSECVTAKRALYSAGFDISATSSDVEFLVFGVTDQPQALQNGAVDAICTPDPVATQAEKEFGLTALLDTAVTEPYASEYCCVTFVSTELAEEHPDIAAKFTDACLKASAWVADHPDETAQLQIDKEYVSGNVEDNAAILKTYEFRPSVNGGYEALANVSKDLKEIGMLGENTDPDALTERSFKRFDGVPDSYKFEGDNAVAVN
ncbi:ABC transporter substrate-binding protein [uncultured Ruminococcus sp.]|uniref:ABC transporter substrate-binding protein n=1 Tax=uncultured Ruminococcus sp. TaxID=165186 RepID=UPI0025CBB380|nr:ABC transporter substrate-binding protein [uncultured Ruminococcus sp.]